MRLLRLLLAGFLLDPEDGIKVIDFNGRNRFLSLENNFHSGHGHFPRFHTMKTAGYLLRVLFTASSPPLYRPPRG